MICVFDCETVPDIELVKQDYKIEMDNEIIICEKAFEIQKERTGSSFLPIIYHKVVAISAVICDDNFEFQKVGSFPKDSQLICDEVALISEFLGFIDKTKPKLVTFNGNNFDLPMLFIRAMKYNICCKAFFNSDKWDGYRSRYSEKMNLDLMDSLSHFGAVRELKLDSIAKMINIPGKFDVKGDDVYKLFFEWKYKEITEYCESDVLNTYWLMLKYELLKGSLSRENYAKILKNFSEKLTKDKSYSELFSKFIQKEIERL
jgi:hypothetical protein